MTSHAWNVTPYYYILLKQLDLEISSTSRKQWLFLARYAVPVNKFITDYSKNCLCFLPTESSPVFTVGKESPGSQEPQGSQLQVFVVRGI